MVAIPVVLNPIAGGGRLLRAQIPLERAAAQLGHTLEWWPTAHPGHASELARRAGVEGRPLVLAFGGDGTYNEVARGVLGSETALGVLPGGTTSVLAYELSLPRDAPRCLQQLLNGRDRSMRVGRTSHGEIFLLMLSAGPDSVILDSLRPGFKRLGGRVGVALEAALELLSDRPMPRLITRLDGHARPGGWTIVGKSRCYAGPFHATPGADPFADHFEVVSQSRVGRLAAMGFALDLFLGRHLTRSDVYHSQATRVQLAALDPAARVAYQVDGDVVGELPVEAWIDPQVLRLRVPAHSAPHQITGERSRPGARTA